MSVVVYEKPEQIFCWSGGNRTVYMEGDSGKLYAGEGSVILDNVGIKIREEALWFQNSGGDLRGYLYPVEVPSPYLHLHANAADLKLSAGIGKNVELVGFTDVDINAASVLDVASARLIIPVTGADPASPRNGEIWLRSDL